MNHESRKTRYRRRKPWMWSILFIAAIGGIGLVFYPVVQKKFLRERGKSELSQTRWLYWCPAPSHEVVLHGTSPCHYVNQSGEVVTEAPRLQGTLFPKLYDERATAPSVIIEERLLAFIRRFYDFGQFIVKNDETIEIGWHGTMRIKTTLKDDPKKVAENLALILEKEIGDRRDDVDYIDLRFGNRAYYTFR